ncbi:hypothetical protein BDA96_07G039400 [Sorghum bicolor]|uniref:Uncharacterized protein n=1 Tax=Sorghum bicolor TaxID=4558 RepID=A0A921U8P4_SORBI|nr:hypothetical protein BDA96_07G039400 [Sorghum bicolor]
MCVVGSVIKQIYILDNFKVPMSWMMDPVLCQTRAMILCMSPILLHFPSHQDV